MTDPVAVEELARQAIAGNRQALEALVRALQGVVHALALRMLWNRDDAQDAAQEILIRIVTRLGSFDFRSRLSTWAYRVAVNYLLDVKKSAVERMHLDFARLSADLLDGLADGGPAASEHSMLVEEVKIGCTFAMLQCLDRPHRLAYILGEILDLPGPDAALALGVDAATLRKRLERARKDVLEFSRANCGLVSDQAACRCHRRVSAAQRLGRVHADRPQFAQHAVSFDAVRALVRRADQARAVLALHRSNDAKPPEPELLQRIAAAVDTGNAMA
jgi:RNA polymerase sigma factor (sigma-70 family)